MEVKEKTDNILSQIENIIINNWSFEDQISLGEGFDIKIYKSNYVKQKIVGYNVIEENYVNYIFLLYEGNKIIGFKLWNINKAEDNKFYTVASFLKTSLNINFTDTLFVDEEYRGNKLGQKLFSESLKYLKEKLKGKLVISVTSKVPLFHQKIIEVLTTKYNIQDDVFVRFNFKI